jgi:hypothetical protein
MTPDLDYLLALGEARSCLAALADRAGADTQASRFERLLIALDILEPDGPATWPVTAEPAAILGRLDQAVDRLIELGGDPAPLALIVMIAHMSFKSI